MTEENVAERVKCRCGLPMLVNAGGARYCENCDGVQNRESLGFERHKTKEDIRFEMSWLRTESEEYVDNTKKPEVGNPNPEEQEEVPPNE